MYSLRLRPPLDCLRSLPPSPFKSVSVSWRRGVLSSSHLRSALSVRQTRIGVWWAVLLTAFFFFFYCLSLTWARHKSLTSEATIDLFKAPPFFLFFAGGWRAGCWGMILYFDLLLSHGDWVAEGANTQESGQGSLADITTGQSQSSISSTLVDLVGQLLIHEKTLILPFSILLTGKNLVLFLYL